MNRIHRTAGFWLLAVLHALGMPGFLFLFIRLLSTRIPGIAAICIGAVLTALVLLQASRLLMALVPAGKDGAAPIYFMIIDILLAVGGLLAGLVWLVLFALG